MHEQSITPETLSILKTIGKDSYFKKFYLAGGTALALYLGHRLSVDLDFFTNQEFEYRTVIDKLKKIGSFQPTHEREHTVVGFLNNISVSFFHYNYPLIDPLTQFHDVSIAGKLDIAGMKVEAIAGRGIKRDFIDLYFLEKNGYSLIKCLKAFEKKYEGHNYSRVHLYKSLTYFEDAEKGELPKMYQEVNWQDVKNYFIKEMKKLMPI